MGKTCSLRYVRILHLIIILACTLLFRRDKHDKARVRQQREDMKAEMKAKRRRLQDGNELGLTIAPQLDADYDLIGNSGDVDDDDIEEAKPKKKFKQGRFDCLALELCVI